MFRNCILAAVSASVLLGVGCGSSSNTVDSEQVQALSVSEVVLGEWALDPNYLKDMIEAELEKGGIDVSVIPEADYNDIIQQASDAVKISMTFSADGTVTAVSTIEDVTDTFSSTWAADGDTIQLFDPETEETLTGTIVDGLLEIQMPVGTEGVQSLRMTKVSG